MVEGAGFGLLLAFVAGMATTVGAVLGIIVKEPGPRFMTLTFAFSAGIMIHVSFVELLPEAIEDIGFVWGHVWFFLGMAAMFLIDVLIPHHYGEEQWTDPQEKEKKGLMKTGLLVALGIGIHNFPEGIAVFAASLQDASLGVALAVAIGLHNIPEGLAVAAPVYAATKSKGKAFLWSFLSGVAEPVGALLAALFLMQFMSPEVLAGLFAFVAGIMVFISLDELIPAASKYGHQHLAISGFIFGMVIMAASIWFLELYM